MSQASSSISVDARLRELELWPDCDSLSAMRLLLVEDSERLRRNLAKALSKLGHAVDEAAEGEEAAATVLVNDYDVIVLDLMLPGRSGLELLSEWRQRRETVPVLILTALDAVEDRVRGLAMGADDYLVKPFAIEELVARLEALVRRSRGTGDSRITVGDFQIDLAARIVKRGEVEVILTAREFSLLECLARHHGRVMSREEIEAKLYGEAGSPVSNAVDVAVYALRRKLSPGDSPPIIHTRRGIGYVMQEKP
ncbi:MAG: response regulator transcription factor [Verrucomicrobiales bacterium]|nr:response regulator transcription factor [Verrucomicrobiales bacterium]